MIQGDWTQLKRGRIIKYSRPKGIRRRHVLLAAMYCLGEWKMKYSGNTITTEEELDIEVMHFKFLYKYNLL